MGQTPRPRKIRDDTKEAETLSCFLGYAFFIENVHLKNTKEFTFYSNNTEREKEKEK